MKQLFLTSIFLLLTICAPAFGEDAPRYWRVDDVRAGMAGTGRTVLEGNQIQEFQFEVIGVLKKVFPDQDLFLVKLSGLGLENLGIVEGMSGSPLYIDGKLLGAVAYGWSFSKEPIGGVTPAETMFGLIADAQKPQARPAGDQSFSGSGTRGGTSAARRFAWASGRRSPGRTLEAPVGLKRLRAPLVVSGCPQKVFAHFAERFEQMGMLPAQGGGGGKPGGDAPPAVELLPGSPMAISFIEGDMTIAGIGTVTERVDDEIIAFGHPMMEMGRVELPLATATVDAVIPNLYSSFRISSAGATVGTLLIDRNEGVYGRIGKAPRMVPLSITVTRGDFPGRAAYDFRLAHDPNLTPLLVDISLFSSVFMKGEPPLDYTLQYKVRVVTDREDVIELEEMVCSGSWWPLWSFFDAVTGTVGTLMYNPFEKVGIKEVRAELDIKLGDRTALIESVRVLDVKVPPGKSARARVRLRRFRQPPTSIEVAIPIPDDLPEGIYNVLLTDAEGAYQADVNAAPSLFDPQSYQEMLRILRLRYPSDRLYAVIVLPGAGLSIRGTPLRNLPASCLSMLTPVGRSKHEFIGAVLKSSRQTEYQIVGSQEVQMVVEKED